MCSFFNISLIFLCAFSFGPWAIANNKVGNGGNVVHCQKPESTKLLDFFEADLDLRSELQAGEAFVIAKRVVDSLEPIAPKLFTQYNRRLEKIQSEIDFRKEIEILAIPDSKHLLGPLSKNCQVQQVAVRKALTSPDEKRFLIREDLWQKLSPTHQAGLLVHEILHEHFTKLGEVDSVKARKVNAHLFGKNLNKADFWKMIRQLEIPIYP